MLKTIKVKLKGTNVIFRDETRQLQEDFIQSDKTLTRLEVIELLPETHTLISVSKDEKELLIPASILEEIIQKQDEIKQQIEDEKGDN